MNEIITNIAQGTSSLVPTFFSRVLWPDDFSAGHRLMMDAVLGGHDPALALLMARSTDLQRGTADQSTGAMAALCDCLDVLQAGGRWSFNVTEPSRWPAIAVRALSVSGEMRRGMLRMTPPEDVAGTLALLCQAAQKAGPYLKRAEPAAPDAPAPAAPAPVSVNVALQLPEGPLPMAIVSQPATRSVQTVERDEDDEITRTITETTSHG